MKYIENSSIKCGFSKDMWQWLVQCTDILLDSCHYQNKNLACNTYFWILCTHVSRR